MMPQPGFEGRASLLLVVSSLLVALTAVPARAGGMLMHATRSGVMCASASALAKLSLLDGSTRYLGNIDTSPLAVIGRAGGCNVFGPGMVVRLETARHNTSIVLADSQTGDGVLSEYLVPNIDFAPYDPPPDPFDDTIRAKCPGKLAYVATLGRPSYEYVQSLPPRTQAELQRSAEATCGDGGSVFCMGRRIESDLRRRGLERPWASFVCGRADLVAHQDGDHVRP